ELEKENLGKFQAAVRKIEQQYEEKIREQYLKNLETAFALAEKILDIEINRNDEAFLGLYKKAAAHIGKTESVQLKVGPRGYEVSSRNREELMKCISGLKNLELEESGEEGTCVIQSPMGEADASIKTQLNRAREIIQAS
ncbi:MAG TPA: FliH/SctL family protein, partial [Clostridia bacterium]|nr:FliH/SctL family protein [Clostridia bacterium]